MTHELIQKLESALKDTLEFSGEVQLLEWSKSTSRDGPKVKFLLQDDKDLTGFELATIRKGKQAGQLYHLFAIRLDEDIQPEQPKSIAYLLHKQGVFNNIEVLDKLGIYVKTGDDASKFQSLAHEKLKQRLGVESLAATPPKLIVQWFRENGLEVYLPSSLRGMR